MEQPRGGVLWILLFICLLVSVSVIYFTHRPTRITDLTSELKQYLSSDRKAKTQVTQSKKPTENAVNVDDKAKSKATNVATTTKSGKVVNSNTTPRPTWTPPSDYQKFVNKLHARDIPGKYQICEQVYNSAIPWSPEQIKRHNIFREEMGKLQMQAPEDHFGTFPGQQRIYHEIAKLDFVQTVCDSGFDAGFSAFTWLNSNPKIKLYSFDPGKYPYFNAVYNILNKMFPGRFLLTTGATAKTLPGFQRSHPEIKCNLIVIPNRHIDRKTPYVVFNNFGNMVNRTYPYNMILVEDWTKKVYKVGDSIWKKQIQSKKVGQIFRCNNQPGTKTLAFGWYP